MNPLISDFVHDALLRGVSREEIALALEKGGWSSKEINTALDAFVDSDLPLPVPRKRVSSSPKEAFLFLMLFASLYVWAFALGSVLFNMISLALPQPGERAVFLISSLRVGIASLIVAFPIFMFMCRIIATEASRNPGQRISPVRRWLTYMTLFFAAISIVADLITLLVVFLQGDVTVRFGLKVLVVAVLAGGIFVYYMRDLRHDEVAPSTEIGPTRSARLGAAFLIIAVLVTIGFGFYFAGSPMKARLMVQDGQRVSDLSAISRSVEQYYWDKGQLPQSLADCDANPDTFVAQKVDRVTSQPYEYRIIDATHFEVGATFELPGGSGGAIAQPGRAPGLLSPGEEGFWAHGAGRTTFTIDATREKRK